MTVARLALKGQNGNWLFANDMVYMLDGPEQRAAEAELSFDYVAEAELTLSRQFHGELVATSIHRSCQPSYCRPCAA